MPLALLASKAKEGAKPGVPVAVVFWLSLKKAPCVSIPVVAFTPELPIMLGPNITGYFAGWNIIKEVSGCFFQENYQNHVGGTVDPNGNKISLDASRSSSVFSKSNSVQPASCYTLMIIKV